MQTPYQILTVNNQADDVEIKKAYLKKVKEYPPDRDQEQFQIIHNAYQAIRDKKSRISFELFNNLSVDFSELVDQSLETEHKEALKAEDFIKLLSMTIDQ